MHDLDVAAWRDVNAGRMVTWADWFGVVEGVEYLTGSGLHVRTRMIDELTQFLGSIFEQTDVRTKEV